ncbi:hypothetical protein V5799_024014 [Amblyomma americanum]|uniref:Uncharacterized protein n=1 Tax=Amblyomma americanum TaxID=6943 RepID=A0AAQ4EDC9_AMBAM
MHERSQKASELSPNKLLRSILIASSLPGPANTTTGDEDGGSNAGRRKEALKLGNEVPRQKSEEQGWIHPHLQQKATGRPRWQPPVILVKYKPSTKL